jgi:hypothetical protein
MRWGSYIEQGSVAVSYGCYFYSVLRYSSPLSINAFCYFVFAFACTVFSLCLFSCFPFVSSSPFNNLRDITALDTRPGHHMNAETLAIGKEIRSTKSKKSQRA